MSDHFPVCFTRKHSHKGATNSHKSIRYRSYKNFNESAFLADLQSVLWAVCEIFDDPNDALNCWYKLFIDIVNLHAPMKERRVKRPKQPEWFTEEIQDAIRERDKFANNKDSIHWRQWRNKVTALIKKSKADYYQSVIEANMGDSKKLWNILREIAPTEKSTCPVTITGANDETLSDPNAIANSFNEFFVNIASSVLENMPCHDSYTNEALEQFINSRTTADTMFEIPPIREDTVLKHL